MKTQISQVYRFFLNSIGRRPLSIFTAIHVSCITNFKKITRNFTFSDGIFITNNSQLTDLSITLDLFFWGDRLTQECKFQFVNNPKLDLGGICTEGPLDYMYQLKTEGNLKNCGMLE